MKIYNLRFLIATDGINTCVGVAFYCPEKHSGMVAHLDSTQNDLEGLKRCFDQLLRQMQLEAGHSVNTTVIISESEHEGLDKNTVLALKELQEQMLLQIFSNVMLLQGFKRSIKSYKADFLVCQKTFKPLS